MKVSLLEYSLGRPWKLTVTFNSAHPEDNQIFCFCWFCLVGWLVGFFVPTFVFLQCILLNMGYLEFVLKACFGLQISPTEKPKRDGSFHMSLCPCFCSLLFSLCRLIPLCKRARVAVLNQDQECLGKLILSWRTE